MENYRSSSEILNLANASITRNTNRQEKTLYRPRELPKNGPKPVWFPTESKDTIIDRKKPFIDRGNYQKTAQNQSGFLQNQKIRS